MSRQEAAEQEAVLLLSTRAKVWLYLERHKLGNPRWFTVTEMFAHLGGSCQKTLPQQASLQLEHAPFT
ncbi:hypothetical protein [Sphingomonas sp. LHG3443-2]|uniref:hypothetical protein n=1 Tax=Sphingomonas sp. LHG3443-2 TaxID=2804639 RepID=UPI003CE9DF26